ncbi:MAG TPA: DegV family protein [Candidatus Bathyarchaeia archaeon]|nr:DegV family protein [Candidatus Bathyarchaeia archaeon]
MSKVKIVSDSACDLSLDILKQLNIETIPARVVFGDTSYSDYDLSREEFYQRLAQGEMPSTGVPAPKVFKNTFENALKESDEVIVFTLSKKLSGIYSTANVVASNLFDDRITILDTEAATLQSGLIVYLVAKKAQEGYSKDELLSYFYEKILPYSQLFAIVDSLKYLKKGGRINTIRWLFGSLLSVKPFIHIENGLLSSPGKVRGRQNALDILKKVAVKALNERKLDTFIIGHANDLIRAQELKDLILELSNTPSEILLLEIGPVVGSHTGPKAIGISWLGEFDKKWLK